MSYREPETLFFALSDTTRRRMFERLMDQPSSVGVLAEAFPISRPAVSQHLKILNDAGLVVVRAEGTRRIYAARPEKLAELRAWLDRYWDGVLSSFGNEIKKMKEGGA